LKFQFKVIRILGVRPEQLEPKLNEFGADGWRFLYANEMLLILGKPQTTKEDLLPVPTSAPKERSKPATGTAKEPSKAENMKETELAP
jgi:hypothetical protein